MAKVTTERIQTLIDKANNGEISQEAFCHEVAVLMMEMTEEAKRDNDLLKEINGKNEQIIRLQEMVQEQDIRLSEMEFLDLDWNLMNDFIQHKKLQAAYSKFAKQKLSEPEKPNLTRIK